MRKLHLLSALVLTVIFGSSAIYAQDFSNKGKEFWFCFPNHIRSGNVNGSMSIWITSDRASSGTIVMTNGTFSTNWSVTANGITQIDIPYNLAHIGNAESGIIIQKSLKLSVNAGQPAVVAYAQQYGNARSAATLLLPTSVLGKKYLAASYTYTATSSGGQNSRSQFQVIATKPNTSVKITPYSNGVPGAPFTINFTNAGDMYQFQATSDVTGSIIESIASANGSCLPIAVFSGSSASTIGTVTCTNPTSYDPLFQQLYPVATWGKNYGFIPFGDYTNGNPYRIMASEDNTSVFINGVLTATLNTGQIYPATYSLTPVTITQPTSITSDKPICVIQYAQTRDCSGTNNGDPDMVILNPIEQNIKDITIFASTQQNINRQWINVLIPTAGVSSFRIDGAVPSTAFQPSPNIPGYSYLTHRFIPAISGSHRITSDSGFNAICYGFEQSAYESYAYSAGTNVKDIYQFISLQNQYATVNFPATCRNTPFFFSMTFPYQPTQIQWIFGAALNAMGIADVTLNAPVPTSTIIVAGKTLYVYQLPTPYTITAAGSYPIKVIATNPTPDGCGGVQEIDFDVQVFDPPVADFTFNDVCFPDPVQFNDNSNTGGRPISNRYWNFGDANTSNVNNPTHLYTAPGAYTVKYAVITDVGCLSDTASHVVTVSPLPTATISGATDVCLNAPSPDVTFTGSAGTAPYTFTYNINGGPNQTVTTTSGNSVTVSVPTSTVGTFTYNLVSVQDASPNLCSQAQTGSVAINVNSLPTATIDGTITVCENAPSPNITFTAGGGAIAPYTFTYTINGGPNQTVTTTSGNSVTVAAPTNTPGTYTYSLVSVSDGSTTTCSQLQSGSATVIVNPLPTASISGSTEVCLNAPSPDITFTGATGSAPYTFTYNINGGPNQTVSTTAGNSVTVSVPTAVAGIFTYNLVSVLDGSSTLCSQAQTGAATVIVNPLPTSSFTVVTPSCETREVSFTDVSVANAGSIISWQWNFGDPASGPLNTSTLQNPTHVFSTAGTYTVSLVVTTDKGCVSTTPPQQVVINARPLAGFIIPEVCLSDTYAQFTDTSSVDAPDFIQAWNWNFGDPGSGPLNTSTLQNPQHSYTATGSYNVQLIATSNNGCRDTVTQVLFINGSFPVADFNIQNPSTLCANDSVAIVEASTVFPGTITKVEIYWDNVNQPAVFDTDNSPFTGKVYKHLYPNFQAPLTRTFTIRYRAYSGGVCVNDKIQDITVNAAPLVQFNAVPDVCFDAAAFSLSPYVSFGAVPGTGTYTGPGVTTGGIFTPSSIAPGGTYTIQYLHTSTAAGCRDSATQTITVIDTASARFVVSNLACERSAVSFNSTSSTIPPSAGTITGWQWDFGDPASGAANTSTLQNPSHLFTGWGTYNVSLVVTTSNSCRSTAFNMPVVVNPIPRPNFSFPASSCLPSANVQFTNLSTIPDGSQASVSYLWNFGDPGSGPLNTSTGSAPSHIYNAVGPYSVNLQVTSGVGCARDTTIVLNSIHPQPTGSFTVDKPDLCVGESFQFTDNSNPVDGTTTQWNWTMGDGNIRTTPSFTYTYGSAGTYDVSLYITNSFGCRSTTFTQQVTVNPYPVVDAGPDLFILEDGSDTLQPIVTAINPSFLWTPNQYFLSSNTIERPIVKGVEDIWYTLTVTGRGECVSSDRVFIKVLKGPEIPNIFSPNGDGIHDRWEIKYLDTYPGGTVEIFNRYGQKIFSSVGYGKPWDGTVNGKPVPVGTYYYIVNPKNGRSIMTGYVDVIR
ncbi:MAG: PKD domain-containing protein [Chitinophagaceae bacterium]|nr:PKD domain-containing protein [Chitinophagaceae bacterium]